jgi:crossover junction endodeoxyribonuclease RuvC
VYEVAATTLKKFATGKGNAKKEQVIGHVQKNWNQLFSTSDEADAFVLYRMALVAAGRVEPKNQPQREAVEKVIQQTPMTASDLQVVCNSKSPS